jgi:N-acetylmuramoyl-L-alanine amidase
MKTRILFIIQLLFFYNYHSNAQHDIGQQRMVIVIDAGHGGRDSGAIAKDGNKEKDIVLDIAKNMVVWNKSLLDSRYDIFLTRNNDTLISLNDRTKLAHYLKPDLFISLHCNHNSNSSIYGVEVYTYDYNESSVLLAQTMLQRLGQKLGFKTREVKQANFHVLRELRDYCPTILVELGYLSNKDESGYLKNNEHRKSLALAVLMAI